MSVHRIPGTDAELVESSPRPQDVPTVTEVVFLLPAATFADGEPFSLLADPGRDAAPGLPGRLEMDWSSPDGPA